MCSICSPCTWHRICWHETESLTLISGDDGNYESFGITGSSDGPSRSQVRNTLGVPLDVFLWLRRIFRTLYLFYFQIQSVQCLHYTLFSLSCFFLNGEEFEFPRTFYFGGFDHRISQIHVFPLSVNYSKPVFDFGQHWRVHLSYFSIWWHLRDDMPGWLDSDSWQLMGFQSQRSPTRMRGARRYKLGLRAQP